MFQFPGFPSMRYGLAHGWLVLSSRVSPFRNLRLIGYLLLPAAYRSLSRLSSALSAKASTLRPYQLNHCISVFNLISLIIWCIALHHMTYCFKFALLIRLELTFWCLTFINKFMISSIYSFQGTILKSRIWAFLICFAVFWQLLQFIRLFIVCQAIFPDILW